MLGLGAAIAGGRHLVAQEWQAPYEVCSVGPIFTYLFIWAARLCAALRVKQPDTCLATSACIRPDVQSNLPCMTNRSNSEAT